MASQGMNSEQTVDMDMQLYMLSAEPLMHTLVVFFIFLFPSPYTGSLSGGYLSKLFK